MRQYTSSATLDLFLINMSNTERVSKIISNFAEWGFLIEYSNIMHGLASVSNEFTCAFVSQFYIYCRKASLVT